MVVGISVDDDAGLPAFVEAEGVRMAYTVAVDKVRLPTTSACPQRLAYEHTSHHMPGLSLVK